LPRKIVEKPYNNGQWTQSRYNSFVKSALRKASIKWPPKYQVLKESQVGKKINKRSGRLAMHHECASCKNHFPSSVCSVDHIVPIIDPELGFISWDDTITRMFCEASGLQVLCKPCHDEKTNIEKGIANARRKANK